MMLAVNFTPERLELVKLLALLTKSKVKAVTEDEKSETVGKVLGLTDDEIAEIAAMKQETEQITFFFCKTNIIYPNHQHRIFKTTI